MLQRLLRRQPILSGSLVLLMLLFAQGLSAQSDAGAGGLRGEISNADGTAGRERCHYQSATLRPVTCAN